MDIFDTRTAGRCALGKASKKIHLRLGYNIDIVDTTTASRYNLG